MSFDDLGKVGKKGSYSVNKNLKPRIKEHSRWQEEKRKKTKKTANRKKKKNNKR